MMTSLQKYFSEERGRITRLAGALGINPAAVSQWTRVPAERVLDVEAATGIPRTDLRPDLYPPEKPSEAAA